MIYLFFLFISFPNIGFADIFAKPSDQTQLESLLAKDSSNYYLRSSYDYNAFEPSTEAVELKKSVSLGCNRYDFHESLKNTFLKPEFNSVELETLMQQLSTSRLLIWQYSSPTLADLYKHLNTIGHLRLGIRYQQCDDLERTIGDPSTKLRKQAVMDCIRRKGSNTDDIDFAFKSCYDHLSSNGELRAPYASLEDPSNGSSYIRGTINVTQKSLERVYGGGNLSIFKEILPQIMVAQDEIVIKSPLRKSRELISKYRLDFLAKLSNGLKEYKRDKVIGRDLSDIAVFGLPFTEGQIRNFLLLDEVTGDLAMNKVASELAYVKTIDLYLQALETLQKVMSHPAIEPGYKTLLESTLLFVKNEIVSLKEEKARLKEYAGAMRSIIKEADQQRLKSLNWIQEEEKSEQRKGLLNLNP